MTELKRYELLPSEHSSCDTLQEYDEGSLCLHSDVSAQDAENAELRGENSEAAAVVREQGRAIKALRAENEELRARHDPEVCVDTQEYCERLKAEVVEMNATLVNYIHSLGDGDKSGIDRPVGRIIGLHRIAVKELERWKRTADENLGTSRAVQSRLTEVTADLTAAKEELALSRQNYDTLLDATVSVTNRWGEVRQTLATRDREISTHDKQVKAWRREVEEAKELRRVWSELRSTDPWHWEHGGENHIETLSCPVLIDADDLRCLVALAKAEANALLATRDRELGEVRALLDLVEARRFTVKPVYIEGISEMQGWGVFEENGNFLAQGEGVREALWCVTAPTAAPEPEEKSDG